jgi:GMP synthase (glutamine-hydrolysing)
MIQFKDYQEQIQGGIAVIDFGGQYAHLIASKIRRLGAYSEILLPDEFFEKNQNHFFKGIILSGGPGSVYDSDAPMIDDKIFHLGIPILGICYGHQYLMHKLGGSVEKAQNREYGKAILNIREKSLILDGLQEKSIVWMSHGDEVIKIPEDFKCIASTEDCKYAVVENPEKRIFGLQFHPEVAHTQEGLKILKNFIKICNLEQSWNLEVYLKYLMNYLKKSLENKKVFFLVSGGVDSTVAFALLGKILDKEHLYGMLVDTGFLRYQESQKIKTMLSKVGIDIHIEDAKDLYYDRLKNVYEPEEKRKIIGELFIEVQQNAVKKLNLNTKEWLLGQGTIYPDTIESGSTKFSHTIKTHHNRVQIIQELLEKGLVVEPLRDLYKDEVREIGKLLGLPRDLVEKHPFPGPGLAVRCLCNQQQSGGIQPIKESLPQELQNQLHQHSLEIYLLPIKSVGVQGDKRSYAHPAVFVPQKDFFSNFQWEIYLELARKIPNLFYDVNRVILFIPFDHKNISHLQLETHQYLTPQRIETLQIIDNIVNNFLNEKNIYYDIWQCPVVLLPLVDNSKKQSIVLRSICSTDAMTASVYEMPITLLKELSEKIYNTNLISYLFYDLTTKPPGTIEWE